MAQWRRKVLNEMTERIVQLGLQTCPICGSGEIVVGRHPVIQSIGAVYQESERRRDLDSNILFMVQVTCRLCGYAMQFNGELLTPLDEHSLIVGMTDEEEAAWEAQQDDDRN